MADNVYRIYNGPAPTTTVEAYVLTGTAIKTMLQIKAPSAFKIVGWGYKLATVPVAAVAVELLTTATINATVTASAAADVIKWGDAGGAAADVTLATSGTGYTSTGEGSIAATRILDVGDDWATSYRTQFPLGRGPGVAALDICRVRALTTATINMICWIDFEQTR
jgi:hypothetical protein